MGDMGRPMTGLLFFTNDSQLRAKINHSKQGVEMLYQIVLDKPLTAADFKKLQGQKSPLASSSARRFVRRMVPKAQFRAGKGSALGGRAGAVTLPI